MGLTWFHTKFPFKAGREMFRKIKSKKPSAGASTSTQLQSMRLVWMWLYEHFAGVQNVGLREEDEEEGEKKS